MKTQFVFFALFPRLLKGLLPVFTMLHLFWGAFFSDHAFSFENTSPNSPYRWNFNQDGGWQAGNSSTEIEQTDEGLRLISKGHEPLILLNPKLSLPSELFHFVLIDAETGLLKNPSMGLFWQSLGAGEFKGSDFEIKAFKKGGLYAFDLSGFWKGRKEIQTLGIIFPKGLDRVQLRSIAIVQATNSLKRKDFFRQLLGAKTGRGLWQNGFSAKTLHLNNLTLWVYGFVMTALLFLFFFKNRRKYILLCFSMAWLVLAAENLWQEGNWIFVDRHFLAGKYQEEKLKEVYPKDFFEAILYLKGLASQGEKVQFLLPPQFEDLKKHILFYFYPLAVSVDAKLPPTKFDLTATLHFNPQGYGNPKFDKKIGQSVFIQRNKRKP